MEEIIEALSAHSKYAMCKRLDELNISENIMAFHFDGFSYSIRWTDFEFKDKEFNLFDTCTCHVQEAEKSYKFYKHFDYNWSNQKIKRFAERSSNQHIDSEIIQLRKRGQLAEICGWLMIR